MSDFASSQTVTARKEHRCLECSRVIRPGEQYRREAGSWEGEFWRQRACLHCAALRKMVLQVDDVYIESYYGGLSAWESDCDWGWECMAGQTALLRAIVNYRRKWTQRDGSLVTVPEATP